METLRLGTLFWLQTGGKTKSSPRTTCVEYTQILSFVCFFFTIVHEKKKVPTGGVLGGV